LNDLMLLHAQQSKGGAILAVRQKEEHTTTAAI